MPSFNALPSLFQTVSSSLLPLTFLIPPCLSLFSPPSSHFPSCEHWQAVAGCSVVSFTTGLHLLPLSLCPGPVIRSTPTKMSQSSGGRGPRVYMYAGRVTQITKLEGGGLKIEVIPRQHSMCVCVSVRFYLTARKGAGSLGDCTTRSLCEGCRNIVYSYVTNLSKCLQRII